MKVAGLTTEGDWRFGRGRAVYLTRSDAIRQNVVTRLRSFTDDWFADVLDGLPWIEMLGERNNQGRILREIERRILTTEGVRLIERLRVASITDRAATIEITIVDMFDQRFDETVALP